MAECHKRGRKVWSRTIDVCESGRKGQMVSGDWLMALERNEDLAGLGWEAVKREKNYLLIVVAGQVSGLVFRMIRK